MINKVILVGNLGADPEMHGTESGLVIANLRIATTERRKAQDGQWVDHTEWHRVVFFGKSAENAAKYLTKGRQVYIEGTLRTKKYTDPQGVVKYATDVVGNDLKFLGGGGERKDNQQSSTDYPATPPDTSNIDDDIPF